MSRTYTFKVIKGSWGIRVALTARADRRDPSGGMASSQRPILDIEDGVNLSAAEKAQLARGFAFAADEVMTVCAPQAVTVVVESVSYVESDYQPEGLAVAILRWLEEEFCLPGHDVHVTFDRDANLYRFEWPK
ncbi:hypothetical protein [Streptacidiphilus sp. MAP5-3]|uniref:hypothetical protein n=1 Tax=unclassified Streptacidiphilus TaxID=2643834 RepID=UPI0035127157